jgi:hypothetical protein
MKFHSSLDSQLVPPPETRRPGWASEIKVVCIPQGDQGRSFHLGEIQDQVAQDACGHSPLLRHGLLSKPWRKESPNPVPVRGKFKHLKNDLIKKIIWSYMISTNVLGRNTYYNLYVNDQVQVNPLESLSEAIIWIEIIYSKPKMHVDTGSIIPTQSLIYIPEFMKIPKHTITAKSNPMIQLTPQRNSITWTWGQYRHTLGPFNDCLVFPCQGICSWLSSEVPLSIIRNYFISGNTRELNYLLQMYFEKRNNTTFLEMNTCLQINSSLFLIVTSGMNLISTNLWMQLDPRNSTSTHKHSGHIEGILNATS